MPGIVVFRRRWKVGSDDFVLVPLLESILKMAWLITLSAVLGVHSSDACFTRTDVLGFVIGTIVLLALVVPLTASLLLLSMRGTIADLEPRRHVTKILVAKAVLYTVELAMTAFGTHVAFFTDLSICHRVISDCVRGVVICGWIVIGLVLVGIAYAFDANGRRNSREDGSSGLSERKLWKRRLRLLCCCCVNVYSKATSNALNDVASVVADYFNDVDLVASDVSVGLLLVHQEQKRRKRVHSAIPYFVATSQLHESRQDPVIMETQTTPVGSHPGDWMTIPLACHYVKFALGSYGWPLFVYSNPCRGPCQMMSDCRCNLSCSMKTDGREAVSGDNCFSSGLVAILLQTGLSPDDIVYANFNNKIHTLPFYVAVDHVEKSVVVAIRGTLSLKDALTDLEANEEDFEAIEGVHHSKAHSGILRSAKRIQETIQEERLLEKAFSMHPSYGLVLTGHSLGAGAAAVLALLLRPVFPRLKCFAFSPPGWLLSAELSRFSEEFVCSVVLGDDLIPRLGIGTMEKLKSDMMNALNSCTAPKYRVLMAAIWKSLCRRYKEGEGEEDGDGPMRDDSPEQNMEQIGSNSSFTEGESESTKNRLRPSLFMPGNILFLEETRRKRVGTETPNNFKVFWRKADSFDEILLKGTKMVSHHLPDVVSKALNTVNQNQTQRSV